MIRLLPWLLLAGCAIDVADFPERAATALCERSDSCDSLVGSVDDCIDITEDVVEGIVGVAQAVGADYDDGAAGRCVRTIRTLPCDELDDWNETDACEAVLE